MRWNARARGCRFPGREAVLHRIPAAGSGCAQRDRVVWRAGFDSTVAQPLMSVDVRVGDYHLDSSNFHQRGRIPGIPRLHRRKWASTATTIRCGRICGSPPIRLTNRPLTQMSLKQAFLRSLTKPPEIDDFSQQPPRGGQSSRASSRTGPRATGRMKHGRLPPRCADFPQIYGTRVNYYLVYATNYLMTSEGTTIRASHSLAAIEAGLDTQADDGMPLHNYYAVYVASPQIPAGRGRPCERTDAGGHGLDAASREPDRSGLHRARCCSTRRPPAPCSRRCSQRRFRARGLRFRWSPRFDQMMSSAGGRQRVDAGALARACCPPRRRLVDDPTMKEFQGTAAAGSLRRGRRRREGAARHSGGKRHPEKFADVAASGPGFHAFQWARALGDAFRSAPAEQQSDFCRRAMRVKRCRPARRNFWMRAATTGTSGASK